MLQHEMCNKLTDANCPSYRATQLIKYTYLFNSESVPRCSNDKIQKSLICRLEKNYFIRSRLIQNINFWRSVTKFFFVSKYY